MPPTPTPLPEPAGGLLDAYLAHLAAGERGNRTYVTFARSFLARWPDPQAWAAEPLPLRLGANRHTRPC
jgi:hypothetical protein